MDAQPLVAVTLTQFIFRLQCSSPHTHG